MREPAAVPPDDRDWTFVITEGCEECGFVPPPPETIGERLRATIPIWLEALAGEASRQRPAPTVWSPLEYGCHVRDVCRTFHQRLVLMLTEDDPVFANWDQDATAIEQQYDRQDPTEVAQELTIEAQAIATAFESVQPDQWDRPGRRSNGSTFTVATFAVYFLHDIDHHVHDVSKRTSYVPVTYERCEHIEGPFYHGTKSALDVGAELVAGYGSNFQAGRVSNNIYFTALVDTAAWGAELASALAGSGERGQIYVVEPTGPFEDDPNVTNKRFPGNPTRSYRTRHPLRVVGEVDSWEGHDPEVLKGMLDRLALLREQGLDLIED